MHQNPDVIICSPTAPFCIVAAYYLSKKHKAKLVFEVRDIWPLTLVAVRGFSKHNLFIRFMGWFESFALKKSDIIVSNLSNYSSHIKNLNIDRASHWVSNGIDLDEMQKIQALSKEILIPQEKFIVGYAGKIGVSNALSYLLEAAKILKHNTNIVFLIVGEGQEKENLKLFSKELENVIFIDAIKKTQVQSMLSHFDICYIGLQKEELFKYGISPNKLFDYMYSEKAILQAINIEDDIVEKAKCGICVEAQNAQAIADAIIKFYEMDAFQRETLGKNAKKYVLKHFTYDKLAEKYLRILKKRYN